MLRRGASRALGAIECSARVMGFAATDGRVTEIDVLRDPARLDGSTSRFSWSDQGYGPALNTSDSESSLLTVAFAFLIVGLVSE